MLFLSLYLGCLPKSSTPVYRSTPMDNHLYVEAKVNNQGPYVFMIDTGSSISLISDQLVETLNLTIVQQSGSLQGFNGSMPKYTTEVDINIDNQHLRNRTVAVYAGNTPMRVTGVELSGLIGNDLLEQFVLELDYLNQTLSLKPHKNYDMPVSKTQFNYLDGQLSIPLSFEYNDQKIDLTGILDTGSNHILLNKAQLTTTEIDNPNRRVFQGVSGRSSSLPSVQVSSINIGGRSEHSDVPAYIFDPAPYQNNKNIVGAQLFRDDRLIINYNQEALAILPSEERRNDKKTLSEHHYALMKKGKLTLPFEQKIELLIFSKHLEEAAKLLLEQTNRSTPNSILLSDIYLELGEPIKALNILNTLSLAQLDQHRKASSKLMLHYFLMSQEEALSMAQDLLNEDLSNATQTAVADLYAVDGQIDKAISLLASLKGEPPHAQMLRRAWYASLKQDSITCLSSLRQALSHPEDTKTAIFFYIQEFGTEDHRDLLLSDIEHAIQYSGLENHDMKMFAQNSVGNQKEAIALKEQMQNQQCAFLDLEEKTNCNALLAQTKLK